MTKIKLLVSALFFTLILLPPSVSASIINAASCNFSAVQSSANSALNGDTVSIPAGSCDWGTNSLTIPGGINIKGAGKDLTIIQATSPIVQTLITFNCANGLPIGFSDITLTGKANPTIWDEGLNLSNSCKDFKIYNSKFRDFVNEGISVSGNSRGVIYNNDFLNNYSAGQIGGNTGYGVAVYGDGTWPALDLGSANAVFVENNYFSGNRANIASNNGSRYVFRYNTVVGTDSVVNYSMVDAHGLYSSLRGSRSWEIYNNTFTTQVSIGLIQRSAIGLHGGDGVVFNNTITNPENFARMVEISVNQGPSPYPAQDQTTSGYFWNNTPGNWANFDTSKRLLDNQTPENLLEGRDYFKTTKPGYTPYTYPHPLRASSTSYATPYTTPYATPYLTPYAYPTPAMLPPTLRAGARVSTTATVNVRSKPSTGPSGKVLGTQILGSLGNITSGPLTGSGYTWWNVNFDKGADGLVAANYLQPLVVATEYNSPDSQLRKDFMAQVIQNLAELIELIRIARDN